MYENLRFAADKPAIRVGTFTDAYAFITDQDLTVTPREYKVGELRLNDDATITNKALDHKITRYGFENFCTILGIPNPFARKIPPDLLLTNIRRLQKEREDKKITLLERNDGSVANIIKGTYKELTYFEMLSPFDGQDVRYIDIGERLMTIGLTFEEVPVGFREDDPLYGGSFVYGSIVRAKPLHMFSGLYRTTCENSFVMSFLGKFRADYKLSGELRMLDFLNGIRCYDEQTLQQLQRAFGSIEKRRMYEDEIVKLWKKVDKIVGEVETNRMFNLNPELQEALFDRVSAKATEDRLARLRGTAVHDRELSDVSYYDVLNAITSQAKDLHEEEKFGAERLAGTELCKVVLA